MLFGKVVPSWPVLIAKTGKHVDAVFFDYSFQTFNKLGTLFNGDMMEAAHVRNKTKHTIAKGQIDEAFV